MLIVSPCIQNRVFSFPSPNFKYISPKISPKSKKKNEEEMQWQQENID